MNRNPHRSTLGLLAVTLLAGCTRLAYVPTDSIPLGNTARLPAVVECVPGSLRADAVRRSEPSSEEWGQVVFRDWRSTRLNAGGTLVAAGVGALFGGAFLFMAAESQSEPEAIIDLGPSLYRGVGTTLLLSGAGLVTGGSILFARGRRTPPSFEADAMADMEWVAPPPGCTTFTPRAAPRSLGYAEPPDPVVVAPSGQDP